MNLIKLKLVIFKKSIKEIKYWIKIKIPAILIENKYAVKNENINKVKNLIFCLEINFSKTKKLK